MLGAARHAAQSARLLARRLDPRHRPLPDFLVIGTQRGGTTSFYDALTQHPLVGPALVKEIHFFDAHYDLGERWYRAHFPRPHGRLPGRTTGEATPYYLYDPRVPTRAQALLPDVRLLVLLRDPVDRAWSHYQRERRMGRESLSFQEALDHEPERLASEGEDYDGPHHRFHSYLARGAYTEQLQRWLAHMSRERMLVLRSEDFYDRPGAMLQRAFSFLGLPTFEPRSLRRLQEGSGTPIDPAIRARLQTHFADDQQRLALLLGDELRWSA